MKLKHYLLVLALLVLALIATAFYTPNTFDGSSKESFIKSMNSITSQLNQEKTAEFMKAYMKILKNENLEELKDANDAKRISIEVMRKKLDGKTYGQVIQIADKLPDDKEIDKMITEMNSSGTIMDYQNDADLIRLEHLLYWTELIEEYYKKNQKYPFQEKFEKNDNIGLVRILTKEQQEFINPKSEIYRSDLDNNWNAFFVEFSMAEFVKELESSLGKSIEEKYDIQEHPSRSPIGYNYFVSKKGYLFWVTCLTCGVTPISTLLMDGFTPTVNIASKKLKPDVYKSFERNEMIKHPIFQEWMNREFKKEEYIRNIEKSNFKDSKTN